MLQHLRVENFAIIDHLEVDFEQGLTTITGETGAGKSILLGALKLVLGERADLKSLRNQESKGIIEATFDLSKLNLRAFFDEHELDYDDETIIRRELLVSGKSRAFINDTPVTIASLQELADQLIDIHSQFNTAKILDNEFQLQIVDAYAQQQTTLATYQLQFEKYQQTKNDILRLTQTLQQLANDRDYKQFLLQELDEAKLQLNELEDLETESKSLTHAEEIILQLNDAYQLLENEQGILSNLREVQSKISRVENFADQLSNLQQRMQAVRIELDDISGEIEKQVQHFEANPERLSFLNERIDLIQNLLRKHQVSTVADLLAIQQQLNEETASLDDIQQAIKAKETILLELENQLEGLATSLHNNRQISLEAVETYIHQTLEKLGMPNARLQIELTKVDSFTKTGKDKIAFLFSANKGIEPRDLEKAVSGGERSRLMLAIKKLLAEHLNLPTLILDEIDTGISGKVANDTGLVMKEMAENMQLLVITHLPQVASKGNHQYKVYKSNDDETTKTQIKPLNKTERLNEIAQMISGSTITESALEQAKMLMQ